MKKNIIPTIDISSILKNDFNSKKSINTVNQINKACADIGFFQVIGHGLNLKDIKKICDVGSKFFSSSRQNKRKLSPKKWNGKNKNLYRGYFPHDVNGKEGLDIGDLKVTKNYSLKLNNQYIEFLNLNKSFDKNSVEKFSKEISPLITAGPPGITGFSSGRAKVQEIIAFWPALISKKLINTEINTYVN